MNIIATRKSALALWQANTVASLLRTHGHVVTLLPTVTTGDKMQKGALADVRLEDLPQLPHLETGKGLFVKEIQEHMLAGRAHIAVHSMKDLPAARTPGLSIAGILPRAPVEDVLILSPKVRQEIAGSICTESTPSLSTLPFEALRTALLRSPAFLSGVIGTTSARRQMQLRAHLTPQLNLAVLRGNVDSRLARVRGQEFAAILLARAGLVRLDFFDADEMCVLPLRPFTPAPAQGVIAIETRDDCPTLIDALAALSCPVTLVQAALERLVLLALGGDCHMAMAAHAHVQSKAGAPADTDARSAAGARGNAGVGTPRAITLEIECARDGAHAATRFALTEAEISELESSRVSSANVYTRFFSALQRGPIAHRLVEHLGSEGFARVSNLGRSLAFGSKAPE